MTKSNGGKIESLQALRTIAFLGIFLTHASSAYGWPSLGVSVFLVLSGFLMMRNYRGKIHSPDAKKNFVFALRRIKKIYNLHIITMMALIVYEILYYLMRHEKFLKFLGIIRDAILNVFLVQNWIPKTSINTSLNGVAWFLSVTVFLYFVFPYLCVFVKDKPTAFLFASPVVVMALQLTLCFAFLKLFPGKTDAYTWFMYFFPVFRVGDFYAGMCLSEIYGRSKAKPADDIVRFSVYELVALAYTIATVFILRGDRSSDVRAMLFNETTFYIPMAAVWIYLFIRCGGVITRTLNNSVLRKLGDISPYMFLIHFVVTQYVGALMLFMGVEVKGMVKTAVVLLELIVTIALSILYKKAEERFGNRTKEKRHN